MKRYLDLMRNGNFVLLWSGQSISQFGNTLWDLSVIWLVYKITGSPSITGLVALCETLPFLLFGMIGGALADRMNRRWTMVWTDSLRCVMVAVPWVLWRLGLLEVWHLAAVAFLHTSLRTLFYPAMQGLVPRLVSEELLVTANSVIQVSRQISRVVGPAITGVLLALFHPTSLLLVDALTFAVSVMTMLGAKVQETNSVTPEKSSMWADIKDVVIFTRRKPGLFWAIVLFGVGLVPISGVMKLGTPLFSEQILAAGTRGYGFVMSAMSVGAIGMGLILGVLKVKRLDRIMFIGWILWGLSFLLLGATRLLWQAITVAVIVGATEAMVDVPMVAYIQRESPEDKVGKLFNLWGTTSWTGDSLSNAIAGPAIAWIGVVAAFYAAGVGVSLVGLLGLWLVWHAGDSRSGPDAAEETATTLSG